MWRSRTRGFRTSEQHRPRAPTPKGRLKNVFYGFQTASKLPTESTAMTAALNKLSFLLLLYAAVSACIFQFVLPDLSADWSVWSAATAVCALYGFIMARRLRRRQDASPARGTVWRVRFAGF